MPLVGESRLEWEDQLLRATASGNLPFNWIENAKVREIFRMLRPAVTLPTCEYLSTVAMDRVLRARNVEMSADLLLSTSGGTP